ncbi:MAG: hypothetical protein ABI707_17715 [Ferruginibacter sp.]
MRKLTAILLIALFAFNLFGYRVLFYFAQQQSDISIEKNLDANQYNEEDLITIKIPMSIPYQIERKDFERFDGEVNLNGKMYRYVKRKVCDGNLILLCLPDHNKMHLETAKNDLFKKANDLQNSASKKSGNSKPASEKNLSSEYNQYIAEYLTDFYKVLVAPYNSNKVSSLASALHSSPEQPPELI